MKVLEDIGETLAKIWNALSDGWDKVMKEKENSKEKNND